MEIESPIIRIFVFFSVPADKKMNSDSKTRLRNCFLEFMIISFNDCFLLMFQQAHLELFTFPLLKSAYQFQISDQAR
jgi:hypothetical protein